MGEPAAASVLVVDDDEQVRRLARTILERDGWRVLEARTPDDALQLLAGDERLDVLLADVNLPGLTGRELALRIGLHRPRARVLYMSGRRDDELLQLGVVPGGPGFLPKPFTPDQLRDALGPPPA